MKHRSVVWRSAGALVLAVVLVGCVRPRPATSALSLTRVLTLPGVRATRPDVGVPGRIDHLGYDPVTQRLFVAALENGSVEVIDLVAGRRIRSLTGLSRPQGIAVVASTGCAAVACGGDGVLHVFDTHSLQELKSFVVGDDADNVRYDAKADEVYVSYGGTNGGAIAVFEPHGWKRLREIPFASRPESFQLDPAGGRLFANLPRGVRAIEDGAVAIANRQSATVEKLIPLAGIARNFPMSFDAAHDRAFVASRRPARLLVIDTRRGVVTGAVPCTDDSDDLFYDAATSQVFVIAGGFRPDLQAPGAASPRSLPGEMGALDVFSVGVKGELTWRESVPTARHARTGLFVPGRRTIYIAVSFHGEREAEIREYGIN